MNGTNDGKVETRAVSMYVAQWAVVNQVARELATSTSQALRIIVRRYELESGRREMLAREASCEEEQHALRA